MMFPYTKKGCDFLACMACKYKNKSICLNKEKRKKEMGEKFNAI